MQILKSLMRMLLIIAGTVILLVVGLDLWSLTLPAVLPVSLETNPHPAADYAAALSRFDGLLQADASRGDLDPRCLPVLLSHGHKTAQVIVLIHGLTACPAQFRQLGEALFERGYNVYIPRLPRHGLADRTSNALRDLTAEELTAVLDPTVDLAAGLGDRVTVTGLSLGGDLSALAGQLRPDVQLAAPMSPAFGIRFVPDFLSPVITRLLLGLPDFYIWWNPLQQAAIKERSGYPGFSSHALGQVLRLGLAQRALAQNASPKAHNLLIITNWGDPSINLAATDTLVDQWRSHGATVRVFRFPLLPWLPHDFVSPDSPFQRIDVAYPKLIELLSAGQ